MSSNVILMIAIIIMAVNARYFDPKYKFEAKNLKTCRPHEPCKFQKKIMSTKYVYVTKDFQSWCQCSPDKSCSKVRYDTRDRINKFYCVDRASL